MWRQGHAPGPGLGGGGRNLCAAASQGACILMPARLAACLPAVSLQHDLFNVFLGGMLGGSIVWGLRAVINEPSEEPHPPLLPACQHCTALQSVFTAI